MISIIVPTIWAYQPTLQYLNQIVGYDCIGEILIIDNRKENRPQSDLFSHTKVRILEQEKNIFVNPAWNLGAKEAKYDNLCFLSDDVIADPRVYFEADRFLSHETKDDHGLIATMIGWELHNQPKVSTGIIEISPQKEFTNNGESVGMHGAFALFFCHRNQYIPIPEELKILSGDAYLWNKMISMGRNHFIMYNFFFYSPWGISCSIVNDAEETKEIHMQDIMLYDKMKEAGEF